MTVLELIATTCEDLQPFVAILQRRHKLLKEVPLYPIQGKTGNLWHCARCDSLLHQRNLKLSGKIMAFRQALELFKESLMVQDFKLCQQVMEPKLIKTKI